MTRTKLVSQAEIERVAWYFCANIPGVHRAGPNRVCGSVCGRCRNLAASALQAAEQVRKQQSNRDLQHLAKVHAELVKGAG